MFSATELDSLSMSLSNNPYHAQQYTYTHTPFNAASLIGLVHTTLILKYHIHRLKHIQSGNSILPSNALQVHGATTGEGPTLRSVSYSDESIMRLITNQLPIYKNSQPLASHLPIL
jgi:hypothetical protein